MALKYPSEFQNGMPFIHFTAWEYHCPIPEIPVIENKSARARSSRFSDEIALYMPGDFTESSTASWGAEEVLQGANGSWGQNAVSNVIKAAEGTEAGSKVLASVKAGTGSIPFPTDILIFQKVDPLGFTLNFKMIPYNLAEADAIKNICLTFKKALMPSLSPGNNVLLKFPDVWDVRFEGINGIGYGKEKYTYSDMALTNCSVTYTSGTEGASVYADGNPTQVNLSVTFQAIRKFFIS